MFKRIKTTSESSVDSGIGDCGTENADDNVTYSDAIRRSRARNSYKNPLQMRILPGSSEKWIQK